MIHTVPREFTAFLGHQRLVSGPLAEGRACRPEGGPRARHALSPSSSLTMQAAGRSTWTCAVTNEYIVARLPQPAFS